MLLFSTCGVASLPGYANEMRSHRRTHLLCNYSKVVGRGNDLVGNLRQFVHIKINIDIQWNRMQK